MAIATIFSLSVSTIQSPALAVVDTSSHHADLPLESVNALRHDKDNGLIICNRCTINNDGGTPGPPGPEGPPGEPGPPGPPGPVAKIETIQRESEPVTIHPGATDHATATCNPDEVVTGGGFGATSGLDIITNLREGDLNSWVAGAENPTSQDKVIGAFVECAKVIG